VFASVLCSRFCIFKVFSRKRKCSPHSMSYFPKKGHYYCWILLRQNVPFISQGFLFDLMNYLFWFQRGRPYLERVLDVKDCLMADFLKSWEFLIPDIVPVFNIGEIKEEESSSVLIWVIFQADSVFERRLLAWK
jgi:hypothetical protein